MKTGSLSTFNPIMVALDVSNKEEALHLAQQLIQTRDEKFKACKPYVKVGMQLFYKYGPGVVKELQELGFRVFLDLKLHDIPHTVKITAESLTHLGVDMFNVHAAGGTAMMEAALAGVKEGLKTESSRSKRPIVIAVTQLTSTSQSMLNDELKIAGNVEDHVLHYARLTMKSGLHGVVCSPQEVPRIKQVCGQSFMTVTPGIRLAEGDHHDQVRVTTPLQAKQLGTDYLVIGRAITEAKNPQQTYQQILNTL